ncbi:dienelactone hydrolase family protein [Actinomycetospora endophytica]|uniref:Dienelactone hydrolase family protein n=1 Tax=Actinomycetospora endophytica TaxID=2291215 RepID=A0ABS8PA37_9PSEU|nr:dienelactone hydrolase family protein [Actinomycetospora endophytica]MCD2195143.1 dienelactone hydrolase family protein [Actinomycetospora endophytica]
MSRLEVTIPTPDGECAGTLHTPDVAEARPAVILFPDAGGARETFRVMADRLAGLGYVVLLPDVYYRHGGYEPFSMDTVFSDDGERARLMSLVRGLTAEMKIRDAGAFLDFLAGRPEVSGTVGTTGYCMGGGYSLLAAGGHPERITAAASFHGGNLAVADDPDSPHRLADHIRATVHVAAAQDDSAFPADQFERLDQALTGAGVAHTIETYPAAHGFAVPDNPTHDPAADERHWRALAELYSSSLAR